MPARLHCPGRTTPAMQRRHFLFLAPLLPSAFLAPRLLHARARQNPPANHVRDAANRIDQLARNIHTPADARSLIDFIAELFAEELPPAWATASLRARLAEREYESATDPAKRISEPHLTETWNAYVSTIGATHDYQISPAELHNLRDSLYAVARLTWARGSRNFWSVPSIFATEPDGTLAPGLPRRRIPSHTLGPRQHARKPARRPRPCLKGHTHLRSPQAGPAKSILLQRREPVVQCSP